MIYCQRYSAKTVIDLAGSRKENECCCSNCGWWHKNICINYKTMNPIKAPDSWFCADWKENKNEEK